MNLITLLALIGASAAVAVSWIAREIACNEAGGDCAPGVPVTSIAIAGLALVVGGVVASWRTRGHPGRWLLIAALVYGVWAIVFSAWVT